MNILVKRNIIQVKRLKGICVKLKKKYIFFEFNVKNTEYLKIISCQSFVINHFIILKHF